MPRSRTTHRLLHALSLTPLKNIAELQSTIDLPWDNRASLDPVNAPELRQAVEHVIAELDAGRLRVATREGVGQWTVHEWVKKAVLLSFRLNDNRLMGDKDLTFFDKVPAKFAGMSEAELRATGVRGGRRPWRAAAASRPGTWC